jgi:hypothetical protein
VRPMRRVRAAPPTSVRRIGHLRERVGASARRRDEPARLVSKL